MKMITRTLLMMLVLLMGTGMTSCEFFSDNPVSPRLKVRVSSMEVQVGASRKCNVSASTRAKLLYASSDESIATVDDKGIVTGVSEGDAVITVIATNQEGSELFVEESAVIAVKVVAKDSEVTEPEEEEEVVKATDLLQEVQKEGATVVFCYYYEGDLFYAAFKKVGDEYVYQEGGNCNKASTRCENKAEELSEELIQYKIEKGIKDLVFSVYSADDAGNKIDPILLDKITTSTAEVEQKTNCPNNYMVAIGAIFQNASIKKTVDEVKEIFNGDKNYQPNIKDTEHVLILTLDENNDKPQLKPLEELMKNAAELKISPEKFIGATIENLKQNVKEKYEDGSSKIPDFNFEDENPSVTWSSTASENTYQQEIQTTGEGTLEYHISTALDNTCGAKIDAESGLVTFEKPGKVMVGATFTDNNGVKFQASYTLTVVDANGGLENYNRNDATEL